MRTVEDFVRELIEKGRSAEEIRKIASVTRWAGQLDEVIALCDKLFKPVKKAKKKEKA